MQNTSADQLVGQTVGDYFIEQLLSQKALGVVYKAQHQPQQRSVMLIVIPVWVPEILAALFRKFWPGPHPDLNPLSLLRQG